MVGCERVWLKETCWLWRNIFPCDENVNTRVVLGLSMHLSLDVEQLDVKIVFLHGDIEV